MDAVRRERRTRHRHGRWAGLAVVLAGIACKSATRTLVSARRAVANPSSPAEASGLNFNENPWQGGFAVDDLTDLVEEAVYKEFEALSERGGVLGAMDTLYQRGKIPEEGLHYEHKKHDGSLPLIGVNTFLPKEHGGEVANTTKQIRSTEPEKAQQIANVKTFQVARNALTGTLSPCRPPPATARTSSRP